MRVLQSLRRRPVHTPSGGGVEVHDATTGEPVARVGSDGIGRRRRLAHAGTWRPRPAATHFGQRAGILKALGGYLNEHKEEL